MGHTIRHNEFVANILEGEKVVGRPRLQYWTQVTRNTGVDSYTELESMVCNNSRWKATNQSKDWRLRRRIFYLVSTNKRNVTAQITNVYFKNRTQLAHKSYLNIKRNKIHITSWLVAVRWIPSTNKCTFPSEISEVKTALYQKMPPRNDIFPNFVITDPWYL